MTPKSTTSHSSLSYLFFNRALPVYLLKPAKKAILNRTAKPLEYQI